MRRLVSPAALAAPHEILLAIPRVFSPSGGLLDVLSTTWFTLVAFVASVPLGVICGALAFYPQSTRTLLTVAIDYFRSIPASALAPIFIVLVGIDSRAKVAAAVFSSTLVIALSTVTGLRGLSVTRAHVTRSLALPKWKRVLLIELPEVAESIFLGLRTGLSLSLILVVVAEMLIGANRGLGRLIGDNRYTDDKPLMYAALVVSGLIGFGLNSLLIVAQRRALHWKGK
ncbi:MAG: ABC transporter permease subunit [Bdellovibrionales bacterium]|nr:ABC transporter permease subunit [Bdellovibrionales bacterium]